MLNKDDKQYIKGQIAGSESRLEEKIRHNGIMIERLEDWGSSLAESNQCIINAIARIEKRLDDAEIDKLPLMWNALKNHNKRITALEAKAA